MFLNAGIANAKTRPVTIPTPENSARRSPSVTPVVFGRLIAPPKKNPSKKSPNRLATGNFSFFRCDPIEATCRFFIGFATTSVSLSRAKSLIEFEMSRWARPSKIAVAVLVCLWGPQAVAQEGPARVIDGDTLDIAGERVRLHGTAAHGVCRPPP